MEFRTIRVFQGSQTLRNGEKFYPISSLASLPNMSIKINTLNVQNRPNLTLCALSEHVSNNLMIVTDLIVRTAEIFDVSEDCLPPYLFLQLRLIFLSIHLIVLPYHPIWQLQLILERKKARSIVWKSTTKLYLTRLKIYRILLVCVCLAMN